MLTPSPLSDVISATETTNRPTGPHEKQVYAGFVDVVAEIVAPPRQDKEALSIGLSWCRSLVGLSLTASVVTCIWWVGDRLGPVPDDILF